MTIQWSWIQGTSGFVPTYSAKVDRNLIGAAFDEGVFRGAVAVGNTPARTVTLSLGAGCIDGDDGTLQGSYLWYITVAEVVAIPAAPASGTTLHWVVLKVQDLADGAGPAGSNNIIATYISGTTGANTPPTLGNSMIPIVQVSMAAGQTAVAASQLTDIRTWGGPKQPVGTVRQFYGPLSRVGKNWAPMHGQVIGTVSAYPDLADHLAVASGSITMPDARGRVMVGLNSADTAIDTVGELAGANTVALVAANLPPHAHDFTHTHGATTSTESATHTHAFSGTTDPEGSHNHGTEYAPNGQDEMLLRGTNTQSPKPLRGYYSATSSAPCTSPLYGRDVGTYTSANSFTVHTHTFSGGTGGQSANHTHTLTTSSQSTTTSGNGPGSSTGVSVIQPEMAVYMLMRVA